MLDTYPACMEDEDDDNVERSNGNSMFIPYSVVRLIVQWESR